MPTVGIEPARKSIFWSQAAKCNKHSLRSVMNTRMKVWFAVAQPDLANDAQFQVQIKAIINFPQIDIDSSDSKIDNKLGLRPKSLIQ